MRALLSENSFSSLIFADTLFSALGSGDGCCTAAGLTYPARAGQGARTSPGQGWPIAWAPEPYSLPKWGLTRCQDEITDLTECAGDSVVTGLGPHPALQDSASHGPGPDDCLGHGMSWHASC
jgi:hypothetical protein